MKKLLLPFVLAGCCLIPTMRLQAEYIKYKDPSVSIPERVVRPDVAYDAGRENGPAHANGQPHDS